MTAGGGWAVERTVGPAGPQHGRSLPEPARRAAWVHRVLRPALVLGSRQSDADVDHAALAGVDVELARRRSGGGAVLLQPDTSCWIDLVVPAGDPLWDDDVVQASAWVGALFVRALAAQGVAGQVHGGRLQAGRWGAAVCFAGVGPGEVLVAGRKVVGLSQRRTRLGARFQCVVEPAWSAPSVLDLLALAPDVRRQAAAELAPPSEWTPPVLDRARLEHDVLAALPT